MVAECEVQAFRMQDAVICLDCEAISDTKANECPSCGGRGLWRLSQWLDGGLEQTKEDS